MKQDQIEQKTDSIGIREQINLASSRLHPGTIDLLAEMYGANELYGTNGNGLVTVNKNVRITVEQGAMMHKLMRSYSVRRSLEIGFAYGFSTIWMLDALQSRRDAMHVAIDPYEKSHWHGIGLTQVKRLAQKTEFEWKEDFSIHALSDLIRKGEKFDFIFIDGNHRFDDVIVDFYLSNQVLWSGGLLVFDDMWMNSVRAATNFIVNNRSFEVVPQPVENMLVLQKTHYDNRDWDHFISFEVLGTAKITKSPPPLLSTVTNNIARLFRNLGKSF